MSEFPRTQKITALVVVSAVVVITLAVVAARGGGVSSEAVGSFPDLAEPTAIPVLEQPRLNWESISSTVRGATATRPPVDCPYIDERDRQSNNFLSLSPALTFVCDQAGVSASPIAPGRVVMRVSQAPLNSFKADLVANGNDGPWLRAGTYGSFVVIDHGPLDGAGNVTSVYAGLDSIDPQLRVGQLVDTTTSLGGLRSVVINDELVEGVLSFELLVDDNRFGADPMRSAPGSIADARRHAELASDLISLPVTTCSLPFGNANLLVGSSREYRSGIHNGLDFNCITNDHLITAAGDGQVIFVVDDYVEATAEDRTQVLAQTVAAFDTPFWTLASLYGNFVVIDHELSDGTRAVTIYAHLSEVDEAILPGVLLEAGTPLGFVGNTGTSAAAEGVTNNDGSVHLHWELHVNDRPIGYLESPVDTGPLYEQILCDPAEPVTNGC